MKALRSLMFLVFVLSVGVAYAHRVNVFAYPEGDAIVVTAKFSTGSVAKGAAIDVLNAKGEKLFAGKTDTKGLATLPLPDGFTPQDLTVKLNASEGHVAFWTIPKADFVAVSSNETEGDIETRIKEALAAQERQVITPLREEIARLKTRGPGFLEIAGGIGWIFGIFGVVAIIKTRRTKGRPDA